MKSDLPPTPRRQFLKLMGVAGAGLFVPWRGTLPQARAAVPPGLLHPLAIPKFQSPLLIPPVMPKAGTIPQPGSKNVDYYEISVRQFAQQILPAGLPMTTVWGYGAVAGQGRRALLLHHAPSLTIEAGWNRPVRIKWINELVDDAGNFRPHLLPVDQTLHWANPPGGTTGRDNRPMFADTPGVYTGPVPIVTHVHGAVGVGDESDGYAEAWYLPAALNVPPGYAEHGTWYEFFAQKASARFGSVWSRGHATFQYPNSNRASTLWYHDHCLGLTRLNVYAGPAGFYLVRGGPAGDRAVLDRRTGLTAVLPGPAPRATDPFPSNKAYYEIPIAIQDRVFNEDGSLFYPNTRAYFDGIVGDYLPDGEFAPQWNPEFFGNCIMVNGQTWPFLVVERRRYRFRFLNGCQSRFLILDFAPLPGVKVWQIGNEGGFLAAPVDLTNVAANTVLLGPAERAELIVDFTDVPEGNYTLGNLGPDEPFGGGVPDEDFEPADPESTGQVLQFRVVPAVAPDPTTPPEFLQLPAIAPLPMETVTRRLSLIERMGEGVGADGDEIEGPVEALLGGVDGDGFAVPALWMDPVTENPAVGSIEVWEIYNTTGDAHPMHVHEVVFEVVNRQALVLNGDGDAAQPLQLAGNPRPPEPWETGYKDTVIAYPGEVTRIRARFAVPGQYVWHCHIVEHEDNEMMRPYRIGPVQAGQPQPPAMPAAGH